MLGRTIEPSSDCSLSTEISVQGCMKRTVSTCSSRKSVAFDCIEILEFPMELGDNPAVHEGPPIQLGWMPESTNVVEVDTYELFRHRRRDRQALMISTTERLHALLSLGYSEDDIIATSLECAKVKHQRCRSAGLTLRNDVIGASKTTLVS